MIKACFDQSVVNIGPLPHLFLYFRLFNTVCRRLDLNRRPLESEVTTTTAHFCLVILLRLFVELLIRSLYPGLRMLSL